MPGRNVFADKVTVFSGVVFALTELVHGTAETDVLKQLVAIRKWFTIIFAAGALLGIVSKIGGAAQRARRSS